MIKRINSNKKEGAVQVSVQGEIFCKKALITRSKFLDLKEIFKYSRRTTSYSIGDHIGVMLKTKNQLTSRR